MYHDEDAWNEFRSTMLNEAIYEEECILKGWLDRIGYDDPIGYYRNSWDSTMEIYARKIGSLIGKAGVHVQELEEILFKRYGVRYKVKFIEIRGGFINV